MTPKINNSIFLPVLSFIWNAGLYGQGHFLCEGKPGYRNRTENLLNITESHTNRVIRASSINLLIPALFQNVYNLLHISFIRIYIWYFLATLHFFKLHIEGCFLFFASTITKNIHFIYEQKIPSQWDGTLAVALVQNSGRVHAGTYYVFMYTQLTVLYKYGGLVQPIQRMHPVLHICLVLHM